jgi:dTDP-glucose pyrophosphorylase
MNNYKDHLIAVGETIRTALSRLDQLAADAILFVVSQQGKLIGSLTDGDVRRGFLKGFNIDNKVEEFIQPHPKYFRKSEYRMEDVIRYRRDNYRIIPVLDDQDCVINIVNFRFLKSYLPLDAVIMAGGRGERLRPLTDTTPKPLLRIGEKPIIEHSLDRLVSHGIDDIWISVRYLGQQIMDHIGDGSTKNVRIEYVDELKPLGTIGAVRNIRNFRHDNILITNSDLLTDLNYEDFYIDFLKNDADVSIVTIPYRVGVPYAVLETSDGRVLSFKEKPTYTYYSNGGIYLMKRHVIEKIPSDTFYNATDLIESLLNNGGKVVSYPLTSYWLDIGRIEDFEKAQTDIKHLKL